MSDDNRHIELIEQYLNGELKGKEKEAFERRMETDPDFAVEVNMHQAIIEGIEDARREELRTFIKQNAKARDIQPAYTRWVVASAAVVVFAVGLYAVFNFYSTAEKDNTLVENKNEQQDKAPEVFDDKTAEDTIRRNYSGNANNNGYASTEEEKSAVEQVPAEPELKVVEDEPQFTHDLKWDGTVSAPPPPQVRDLKQPAKEVELSLRKDVDHDGVDNEFDTEDFDESLVVEDFGMEDKIETTTKDKKALATKNEEIKVAKDVKLFDTTIVMQQFTPPSSAFNATTPATINFTNAPNLIGTYNWSFGDGTDSTQRLTVKSNVTNVGTFNTDSTASKDKVADDKDKKAKEVLPVNIQFWKSPVNYKGYSFNGKNLKLYGMDKQTKVYIYKLSGSWYMKMGDFYYYLNPDNQFHTYKRLEDTFIIKQLETD